MTEVAPAERTAREGLIALHDALIAHGGPVADAVLAPPASGHAAPGPAQVAAAGPRAAETPEEYELLLEMILEGSRLHYGEPLIVSSRSSYSSGVSAARGPAAAT